MANARSTPAAPNCRADGGLPARHQSAAARSATIEIVSKPTRLSMTSQGVSAVRARKPSVITRDPVSRQAVAVGKPTATSPKIAAGSRSTATVSGRNRSSAASA